jgi:hypothetical protein
MLHGKYRGRRRTRSLPLIQVFFTQQPHSSSSSSTCARWLFVQIATVFPRGAKSHSETNDALVTKFEFQEKAKQAQKTLNASQFAM